MAQGSGTLKNLNLAYEREVSVMQKSIIKLREQEKNLKAKLKQYELFVEIKGLVDAFKDSYVITCLVANEIILVKSQTMK